MSVEVPQPERSAGYGSSVEFVRYQGAHPVRSGRYPGVFALANGLAAAGRLSPDDRTWWRSNNNWFDREYTDPATVDPGIFDRRIHPHTSSWFRPGAAVLIERTRGYLDLLDRYDVAWVELRSADPGPVVYADEVQIVVAAVTPGR